MALIADLMPAIGQWLKSTRLTELSVWIGDTPLSMALNQNNWITPTLQSIHLLAIALTFSDVAVTVHRAQRHPTVESSR